jgi:hypothetical protein
MQVAWSLLASLPVMWCMCQHAVPPSTGIFDLVQNPQERSRENVVQMLIFGG